MECHSGLSGLLVERARGANGECFNATWSSSLTSSTIKGKPDIETVNTTDRLAIVHDVLEVTSLPLIYDGDTGGVPEIFHFTVRSLERLGVSACVIEDKTGLKQNSLFGTDRKQQLEDIDAFCAKIAAGKKAQVTEDFMIFARMESLIAGLGQEEALRRSRASLEAGVDGIMIHSKEREPDEILSFLAEYQKMRRDYPGRGYIIAVPTTYNSIKETELHKAGVDVVIHANQLIRSAVPAMKQVAESILTHGRSKEVDSELLSVKEILGLIDDNTK
uniref:phosphoenolpyruvate mutase n=1 Tax=Alexandrium catenella TaxID=2925 RepID=A0A7S1LR53_ALECA